MKLTEQIKSDLKKTVSEKIWDSVSITTVTKDMFKYLHYNKATSLD